CVDNDRTGGSLASSTQVFVIPAPVPETCFAGKEVRVPGRIVVQNDEHLTLQVLSLEIVPLVFGSLDSVTDKHQFGILDLRLFLLYSAGGDELVPLLEGHFTFVVAKGPLVG